MPLQMNMRIDGVTGESGSFQHKGWFEVISWNWGMTSNRKSAHETENDKTSFNEMSVVKIIGIDSPAIRRLFAMGSVIPTVDFSVRPETAKRQAQSKYMEIKLESVRIKSIVTGGGIEDKFLKEHITLLFDRVRFEYSKVASHNQEGGDGMPAEAFDFGWNISDDSEWKETK